MNAENGQPFVIGLNHRTTPLERRERFSLTPEAVAQLSERLRSILGWAEVVVLNTCNRLEIYGAGHSGPLQVEAAFGILADVSREKQHAPAYREMEPHLYVHSGGACIHHLFRVASSLDSLVLGETEIVGQVKKAYQQAQAAGTTGKTLNRLFQKALSVSKQVRTRSGIGRCSTSVGSVALDLAEKIFGEDLSQQTILIVGAGKIGETTLRHLSKRGVRSIHVTNRSFDRARELAAQFGGQAVPFASMLDMLAQADIVISSTSAPHWVLAKDETAPTLAQRRNRPLLLIDLAVPRDIDPRLMDWENVYLYNIDQLAEIARLNAEHRKIEAAACEELVEGEARSFAARVLRSPRAEPENHPQTPAWVEELALASASGMTAA